MNITTEQIRAARALKGWGQLELAERSRLSQVTVANIESGKSGGSKESLRAIQVTFENSGIEFIENGLRLTPNILSMIDGKDAYLQLLDDILFSLRDQGDEAEVLFFGMDERRSSPKVKSSMRKLRKAGVKMRSLVAKSNSYILGSLDEYREIDPALTSADVVTIYSDKVAFLVEHTPYYRVLLVKNEFISNDQRRIFEYFWRMGKQPALTTAKESYE
jgi:transcriptional regulator with XRE-family HTH domain